MFHVPDQAAGHLHLPPARGDAGVVAQGDAVQHLAIHVKLALAGGGVAKAHRRGSVPAGKMGQLRFVDAPAAIHAIHDPHLVWRPGDRAQQPVSPGPGFALEAAVQQRRQGEGAVPQPAVAVVPVHAAARLLRQAQRRRCDDAARGQVGQRPQGQQGALHCLRPVGRLVKGADPAAPGVLRVRLCLRRVDWVWMRRVGPRVLQHVICAFPGT